MKVINEKDAIKKLHSGFPLGFPTDTLPAIGCLPEYSETIYKFKKRDKNKALILMASEISEVLNFVHQYARYDFQKIAEEYWPGPLTMVIPISEEKSLNIMAKNKTLGIRIPNSLTSKSLISRTGPLATSSANISGKSTSLTAKEVSRDLPELELLGPTPWESCSGEASTIIAWIKQGKWEIIRQGEMKNLKI